MLVLRMTRIVLAFKPKTYHNLLTLSNNPSLVSHDDNTRGVFFVLCQDRFIYVGIWCFIGGAIDDSLSLITFINGRRADVYLLVFKISSNYNNVCYVFKSVT